MFGLGPWEVVLIVFVAVLVFGTRRLPELGSALGEGIKNFKKSYREAQAIETTSTKTKSPENESSKEG